MNLQYSSVFRSYSSVVPHYLHNRPRSFVVHCMEKLDSATNIPARYVCEVSTGIVEVKSSMLTQCKFYQVKFGGKTFPRCECEDWQQKYLPCKHMFAAIVHPPNYTFQFLGSKYLNSPFFTLDESIIKPFAAPTAMSPSDITPEVKEELPLTSLPMEMDAEPEPSSNPVDLPLPSKGVHLTTAADCRDLLHQIRGLTYLIADANIISQLEDKLSGILGDLKSAADKENGFILEEKAHKPKKKAKISSKASRSIPTASLPSESKIKMKKRRYGQGFERIVASRNFKIEEDGHGKLHYNAP